MNFLLYILIINMAFKSNTDTKPERCAHAKVRETVDIRFHLTLASSPFPIPLAAHTHNIRERPSSRPNKNSRLKLN